jgi:hypothetical protein
LRKQRLTPEKLKVLSANHEFKVCWARRLREETTMDLKWIAEALAIGSWKYLSNLLSPDQERSGQGQLSL